MTDVRMVPCVNHPGVEHRDSVPCPKCMATNEELAGYLRQAREGFVERFVFGSPASDKVPTHALDVSNDTLELQRLNGLYAKLSAANSDTIAENARLREQVQHLQTAMCANPKDRPGLVCDNEWADD